jgi:hypothetical protein
MADESLPAVAAGAATVLLFSYGTLQDRAVQLANFGRVYPASTKLTDNQFRVRIDSHR